LFEGAGDYMAVAADELLAIFSILDRALTAERFSGCMCRTVGYQIQGGHRAVIGIHGICFRIELIENIAALQLD